MSIQKLSTTGTPWTMPAQGLVSMKPTSIAYSGTSAAIGLDGEVTFSAVTSLSLDGVFTSDYDNYQIVVRCVSTADEYVRARLRTIGVDASDTGYTVQRLSADGTTVTAARDSSQTSMIIGSTSDEQRSGFITNLYGPGLAQATAVRGVTAYGYNSATIFEFASTHSVSSVYDGITIFPGSGNVTGSVHVYGYGE